MKVDFIQKCFRSQGRSGDDFEYFGIGIGHGKEEERAGHVWVRDANGRCMFDPT
jgi:hypothetical protein